MKIKQRKLFKANYLELSDIDVRYGVKNFQNTEEVSIPFESFVGKRNTLETAENIFLIIAIILIVVAGIIYFDSSSGGKSEAIVGHFMSGFGLISLLIYWFTLDKFWIQPVNGGTGVYIYKSIPSKIAVDTFIEEFEKRRKIHLLDTYGRLDPRIPFQAQNDQLVWLLNANVISKKDFQEKLLELETLMGKKSNEIGFGKL